MRRLSRSLHVIWALAVAFAIVVPALPGSIVGDAGQAFGVWMKNLSVKQRWGMYAPDPQRSQAYMRLTAHYADGSSEDLEESAIEERGWTRTFMWNKTRKDIWRHYANFHPKKRSAHRDWYLRGVCVREARRRGEPPKTIEMVQIRRRFTPPKKVRAGKPGLGPPRERKVQTMICNAGNMLRQIESDRGRRAEG